MPETTVLLPSRDGWPLLRQSVVSTLADLPDDGTAELLVIDDGSTDGSGSWLDGLAAAEPRTRVLHTGGVGLSAALNAGLAATSSRFVARMDADDVWLPGRLAAELAALRADDDLAAVGCQITRLVGGRWVSVSRLPEGHDGVVAALLRGDHALCHPATMLRRSAVEEIGGYWPEGMAEDIDLFLRLSRVGRLANLPVIGLAYRYHGRGINAERQLEYQLRTAYSVATYRLPRGAVPYAAFERELSPWRLMNLRRKARALSLYRAGLIAAHDGHPVAGRARLLAGASLLPERAVQRIARTLPPPAGRVTHEEKP